MNALIPLTPLLDSWDRDCPALGQRRYPDGRLDYLVRWHDGNSERIAVLDLAADTDPASARRHAEDYVAAIGSHGLHRAGPDPAYLAARARCTRPLPISAFYRQVRQLDIDFGPSFRAVTELWKGRHEAIGRIELDAALPQDQDAYLLHPVFLDACLQIFGATLYDDPYRRTFLPVGMERFRFDRPGSRVAWSHVRLRRAVEAGDTATVADVRFFDEAWQAIGGIDGFSLLLGDADTFSEADYPAIRQALYTVRWEPAAPTERPASPLQPVWLILANPSDASALAAELERDGQRAEVRVGESEATLTATIASLQAQHGEAFAGVIDWYHGEASDPALLRPALAPTLAAAQALLALPGQPPKRYYLVGHQAMAVEADDRVDPVASARWGLGRTMAREQSGLRTVCVDLDHHDSAAARLMRELASNDGEEQVAWRGQRRLVARLASAASGAVGPGQGAYRLAISAYGSFDQLHYRPLERRAPDEHEVEIAVRATGLNFKDVLHALGMLAVEGQQSGAANVEEMLFGGDCAGEVLRVGRAVTDLRPGDRVLACMAFGCLGSHVNVERRFVAALPEGIDECAAATLPTAFLTAYYALVVCAGLRAGERVLIHAGAGAVGMAAIQLAQRHGAEVYATASPPKQALLRELGVVEVMNSRDLDFARHWAPERGGGFDVILNSLGGDFIRASHDLLKPAGRFIEIGKLGILSEAEALERQPGSRYIAFDLMDLAREQPELIAEMLHTVLRQIEQGHLRPLPQTRFPAERCAEAFRCMAQARHIGKIVIEHAVPSDALHCDPTRLYLVSGGLGALGLMLARWLVRRGARRLVLLGRSAPDAAAAETLATLRDTGASIDCRQFDVGDAAQVETLFDELDGEALDGIFHAAGTLDDATLPQQDWPHFERTLHGKALGAWHLHQASRRFSPRWFVCFSSIAGLFGGPGQANYAAASAFLDGLAHHRRSQGLPALSIDWGPWAGAGMAARLDTAQRGRLDGGGVTAIEQLEGLHALECLLRTDPPQAAVFPADWPRLLQRFGATPFYREVAARHVSAAQVDEDEDFSRQLGTATPSERPARLTQALRRLLGSVLRADPATLDPEAPLRELGVDSLMGVELRSKLERLLGRAVPIALLLQGPSITVLGSAVLELLGLAAPMPETDPAAKSTPASSWLLRRPRSEAPALRLFCFAPLGSGAGLFQRWQEALPAAVEVVAVQLPGREERFAEPALTDFAAAVEGACAALAPLLDRPWACYGHSMGTLLAYEVACTLRERHGQEPHGLFVGGLWAPGEHDARRAAGTYERLDLDRLVLPEQLDTNIDYLDNLRRVARADAALLRGYQWRPRPTLACPVVGFYGEDDPIASQADLAGWTTISSAGCRVEAIGGGHMFMVERREALLARLSHHLSAALAPAT
ncbi:SDR family NAD(P)-dependent oxidoreductase [Chitinimonas lacunae]|uniref:SDR family NAD(P)-dependent oxidoreductase n=1 Tax=Chitinimonas lacunae TaxID=1963018 RepID=A0ABV8MT36_9NEIS